MGLLFPNLVGGRGSLGLLVVRVVAGVAFVLHGWPKIQSPMDWMNKFNMPDPAPAPLQALAAIAEFGGGIALILGVLTPLFALLLAGTMGYAIKFHLGMGHGFVDPNPKVSYELAAVYLAVMIMLILVGPGGISVDALLFRKKAED